MVEELSRAKNVHEESFNEQVCTLSSHFSSMLKARYQLQNARNEINEGRKAVKELSHANSALEQRFNDQVCPCFLFITNSRSLQAHRKSSWFRNSRICRERKVYWSSSLMHRYFLCLCFCSKSDNVDNSYGERKKLFLRRRKHKLSL